MKAVYLVVLWTTVASSWARPNIVIIVADDLACLYRKPLFLCHEDELESLYCWHGCQGNINKNKGWNDVGFHGNNDVSTPNLDALAYSGVILNNYYVLPLCSPSRAALFTGRHPIHTGMHHNVMFNNQPYGLGLSERLLPQYLRDLGYKTHLVGKWHLGKHKIEYTPTFRGFDTFFGYWGGRLDYYTHTSMLNKYFGYDLRRGVNVTWEGEGQYATSLFSGEATSIIRNHNSSEGPMFLCLSHLAVHTGNKYQPLQAPQQTINKFNHIKDKKRKTFAAMVSVLDDGVGDVVTALADAGMLENSVIMFTSDNGGAAGGFDSNAASNWPFKGTKDTIWEGGIRGAAFIWSPLLGSQGRVSTQLSHIQDWLPTLLAAAHDHTNTSLDSISPSHLNSTSLPGDTILPENNDTTSTPASPDISLPDDVNSSDIETPLVKKLDGNSSSDGALAPNTSPVTSVPDVDIIDIDTSLVENLNDTSSSDGTITTSASPVTSLPGTVDIDTARAENLDDTSSSVDNIALSTSPATSLPDVDTDTSLVENLGDTYSSVDNISSSSPPATSLPDVDTDTSLVENTDWTSDPDLNSDLPESTSLPDTNLTDIDTDLSENTNWTLVLDVQDDTSPVNVNNSGNLSSELDGRDIWSALKDPLVETYDELLVVLDPLRSMAALRVGKWKFLQGSTWKGRFNRVLGKAGRGRHYNLTAVVTSVTAQALTKISRPLPSTPTLLALREQATIKCPKVSKRIQQCRPENGKFCLFDMSKDPCETNNVAYANVRVEAAMRDTLARYKSTVVKPRNRPTDPASNPKFWNNTWTNWQDFPPPSQSYDFTTIEI